METTAQAGRAHASFLECQEACLLQDPAHASTLECHHSDLFYRLCACISACRKLLLPARALREMRQPTCCRGSVLSSISDCQKADLLQKLSVHCIQAFRNLPRAVLHCRPPTANLLLTSTQKCQQGHLLQKLLQHVLYGDDANGFAEVCACCAA